MNCTKSITRRVVVLLVGFGVGFALAGPVSSAEAGDAEIQKAKEAKREAVKKAEAKLEKKIAQIALPEDTGPTLTVRRVRITGNDLIPTAEVIKKMPLIYNAGDMPLEQAPSDDLYDFRPLLDIILNPGEPRQISVRTIQGLTQYVLSVYQGKNYAGIYVHVPPEAMAQGAQLRDGVLPVKVLEAKVASVTVRTYDANGNETQEPYLRHSAVEGWSPARVDKVANQKKLDDFVNLLNLNPDRYVSAVVTGGDEPNTLAINYDIYETSPWHWFIQTDNSGTSERQWNPRVGLINTNLFGIDDKFMAVYQAPWDSTIDENYSLYGSYDFPLLSPRLRLNVYAGHSEYDINPETGIFDFIGRGTFYGGVLRYNVLQTNGWFVDIKGSLEHTRSKVNPSLFAQFLGTDIKFWLWGTGVEMHRSDDMTRTVLGFDRYESLGGESGGAEFRLARTNAESDFTIYSGYASHSQFLDPDKVNRLSGTFQWSGADERLVPAKMRSFGGLYTVRGYDEYEYIADGGILASFQYEYDLVKRQEAEDREAGLELEEAPPFLRKLAPVAFFDYGRGKIRHPVGTEKGHEELMSAGVGLIMELGDNFSGSVYYGYPLTATDATSQGKGRANAVFILRW